MAALPPQSGIARELETETDRDRDRDEVEVRIFLSPLSFLFLLFLFLLCTVHDFVLYSVFSAARLAILLYFCRFLRRLAMFKRQPHPQCLPVSLLPPLCLFCLHPCTPYPSWLLHLLPRICCSWITKVNWADTATDTDTCWCTVESVLYCTLAIISFYGVISC